MSKNGFPKKVFAKFGKFLNPSFLVKKYGIVMVRTKNVENGQSQVF